MPKYLLELTEEELEVIEKSLNQFYNIGLGHFKIVMSNYNWKNVSSIVLELLELATKELTGLPKHILWGITDSKVSPDCRIAEALENKIKKMFE